MRNAANSLLVSAMHSVLGDKPACSAAALKEIWLAESLQEFIAVHLHSVCRIIHVARTCSL